MFKYQYLQENANNAYTGIMEQKYKRNTRAQIVKLLRSPIIDS
jgi:hypothetical protein